MADMPVDFENLRAITGGDPVFESELFSYFLNGAATCLRDMQQAVGVADDNVWRQQAHAFKGLCYNLGATRLGELCAKAQNDCRAPQDEKTELLSLITDELKRVSECLAAASAAPESAAK